MPPPPHTKPENVLKRAQELIGVQQSQAALSLLHEHVISKRTRNNPIASLEPVMLLFVELCVDLRKGKAAKDGLYSYKNTAQNTNVATIELVLRSFIERARKKVEEAQEKADEVHSSLETGTSTQNVDDLEASETPESILLSTVSGEQSRDRTDRAIVTPWLKFLWETYRTVLDILKNNSKLEIMYQSTAHEAFTFCQKYTRKTEFRRLCELLRNHLQNAAKYQSQIHAINLSDADTLQRHLDTRFQQLNVAVELELWQEAFRSVEDIHTLLNLSKRPAKNIMMANYFEKLTTIFLVSENYLFHSAAYVRLFNLLRSSIAAVASGTSPKKDNPPATEQDLSNCASFVVLSALSIPVISTSRSRGALVDVDEAKKAKNQRLTNLIGMTNPPTRSSLFKEIQSKGLLKRAKPEIRELYNILEVDFHPLSICKKISPILAQIGSDPEMGKYVFPLQQVILTRLFQQLSQVYESVDLKFVLGLAQFPEPFQVTSGMVEKFIMNGCKKGDLAIRINHASGVITFDSDVFSAAKALHPTSSAGSADSETGAVQRLQNTPAEIVRSQLTRLSKSLYITCQYVDPSFNDEQRKLRSTALQRAEAGAEQEHKETLDRRAIIERKKQDASNAAAKRARDEAQRKQARALEQQQEEKQRQIQEQNERDRKRQEQEANKIKRDETMKQIKDLQGVKGVDINSLNPDELDPTKVRAMILAALERDKNELTERLRVTGKRIDHLERAFRREEIKHLHEDYEDQKKRDFSEHEKTTTETLAEAERKHKEDVALKRRLSRLLNPYEQFRDKVTAERAAEFERRRKQAAKELDQKKQQRVREFRERRAGERRAQEQQEREEREERERVEREEAEKTAREEERRTRMAEERSRREEERKKLDEVAARQRQREEEAEARAKARAGGPSTAAAGAGSSSRPSEPVPSANGPPRIAGGRAGGWREREAAKANSGAHSPAPDTTAPAPAASEPPPAAAPSTRGGYVPPHLRNRGAGTGDTPSPAGETMSEGWRSSRAQGREDGGRPSRGPSGVNGASSGGRSMGERSYSGRGPPAEPPARTESPADQGEAGASQGRYRPGMFSQRKRDPPPPQ